MRVLPRSRKVASSAGRRPSRRCHRNEELNKAMTDVDWLHEVELPVYRCMGHSYRTMHYLCQRLSRSPRTHAYRRDAMEMSVSCFANRQYAKQFRDRFGGEL